MTNPMMPRGVEQKELDFVELENLGEALFDFNSEEDLKNWLEKK